MQTDAPKELSGEKKNYQIYRELQPAGKKQRFRLNIEAIRLLKTLEEEGRYAEKTNRRHLQGMQDGAGYQRLSILRTAGGARNMKN